MITRRIARPLVASSPATWTCPSCTRASLQSQTRRQQPQQRRGLQNIPTLTYDNTFKRDGIPGLLSPQSFQLAWLNYQGIMVDKMNEITTGEPWENSSPKDIAIQFARDPASASLFNYASMAHNNHVFFMNLSTSPRSLDKEPTLKKSLIASFGSIETLRLEMLNIATAMFGPGFVWLVWARELDTAPGQIRRGGWRVLTTYLAGTPYAEAGYRQQGIDTSIEDAKGYAAYMKGQPVNSVGQFGSFSTSSRQNAKLPPGGTNVLPVLCVNTWEHVWLRDYGINGKRAFLHDWWEAVDWGAVDVMVPAEAKNQAQFQRY